MLDNCHEKRDDFMIRLFYGSFEKVLRDYMTPHIGQKDLANLLLLSPAISSEIIDGREREDARNREPAIDDTSASRFCKGTRKISPVTIESHLKPNAFGNVEYCFLTEIVPRIPIKKREALLADVLSLVEEDVEISAEEKIYYSEIATTKELATFLAEIYMLVITGISMVMRANHKPKAENLPSQNRFFCGREELLIELKECYQNGVRLQGIYGMGGVGKTQTALQYAYNHINEYRIVWWMSAENKLALQNSASDFLRTQGYLPEKYDADQIKGIFTGYFAAQGHWLLIYDNAEYGTPDEYEALLSYFPPGNINGDILITTRCKNAFEDALHIELPVFREGEAVSFLQKRTSIMDAPNAAMLAAQMGYLPLALEYASAYIREAPEVDYAAYSKKLEQFGIKVLDRKVGNQMYRRTVREAFHITLDRLLSDSSSDYISQSAWQFLNICAFLAPDGIDLRIFSHYRNGLPQPIRFVLGNELDRDEFVRGLTRYSLVRAERGTLSIHQLLQEVLRDELQPNDAMLCVNFAYGVFYQMFYSMRGMSVEEIRPLLFPSVPHVQAILFRYVQFYQNEGKEIPDYIMAAKEYFSWTGILLTDWKNMEELEQTEGCQRDVPILQAAVGFYEMMPGNKTIYFAYTLMLLAQSNKKLGDIEAASGQYLKALETIDKVISKFPVDTNFYTSDKVGYLYQTEAFQLASDICAAIGSCDMIYSNAELLWTNHRSLIKILLKQFACFPRKADADNYRETWLNLWIFSQQIANYTRRAFILRLNAPNEWMDERQYSFLDGVYGFFFPAEPIGYKLVEGVIGGFDFLLTTKKGKITKQGNGNWTTLIFDEDITTLEEMLTALLDLEIPIEELLLRRSLYSVIFLLAKKLDYEDVVDHYRDMLL